MANPVKGTKDQPLPLPPSGGGGGGEGVSATASAVAATQIYRPPTPPRSQLKRQNATAHETFR